MPEGDGVLRLEGAAQLLVALRRRLHRLGAQVDQAHPLPRHAPGLGGDAPGVLAVHGDAVAAQGPGPHQGPRPAVGEGHLQAVEGAAEAGPAAQRRQGPGEGGGDAVAEVDQVDPPRQQRQGRPQPRPRQEPGQVQDRVSPQGHPDHRQALAQVGEQLEGVGLEPAEGGRVAAGDEEDPHLSGKAPGGAGGVLTPSGGEGYNIRLFRRSRKERSSMEARAFAAELAGTFTLVFIGAGAVAVGVGGLLGAAFAHGFVVLAFSLAWGRRAPHINPAVTFGPLHRRRGEGEAPPPLLGRPGSGRHPRRPRPRADRGRLHRLPGRHRPGPGRQPRPDPCPRGDPDLHARHSHPRHRRQRPGRRPGTCRHRPYPDLLHPHGRAPHRRLPQTRPAPWGPVCSRTR